MRNGSGGFLGVGRAWNGRAAGSARVFGLMGAPPGGFHKFGSFSPAAALKVSDAQTITCLPADLNRCASLPMVVVLPTPLTPTIKMTNGFPSGTSFGGV